MILTYDVINPFSDYHPKKNTPINIAIDVFPMRLKCADMNVRFIIGTADINDVTFPAQISE